MTDRKILYVNNKDNLEAGLGFLPMGSISNRFEYDTATNYIRAKRKIESGKNYNAVIMGDLEIPQITPNKDLAKVVYKETDSLVLNGLPIENALNLLRLFRDKEIPRIAVLNAYNPNTKSLIKILNEEELARIINRSQGNLSIEIYSTLRDILKITD
jgi:hypothetical protein